MRQRTCVVCDEEYRPTYSKQETCGRPCGCVLRGRRFPRAKRPPVARRCGTCGVDIPIGARHRYCSSRCRPSTTPPVSDRPVNFSPPPLARRGTYVERLLSRFEVRDNGCWLWTGTMVGSGYGHISRIDGTVPAHRAMWEHHRGEPVPEGMDLDHLCRVRRCVNPDHLEPVTRAENIRRARKSNAHILQQVAA